MEITLARHARKWRHLKYTHERTLPVIVATVEKWWDNCLLHYVRQTHRAIAMICLDRMLPNASMVFKSGKISLLDKIEILVSQLDTFRVYRNCPMIENSALTIADVEHIFGDDPRNRNDRKICAALRNNCVMPRQTYMYLKERGYRLSEKLQLRYDASVESLAVADQYDTQEYAMSTTLPRWLVLQQRMQYNGVIHTERQLLYTNDLMEMCEAMYTDKNPPTGMQMYDSTKFPLACIVAPTEDNDVVKVHAYIMRHRYCERMRRHYIRELVAAIGYNWQMRAAVPGGRDYHEALMCLLPPRYLATSPPRRGDNLATSQGR